MDKNIILKLVQMFEERKEAGDYDHILARRGETLIRVLSNSDLTPSQIECATKETVNKTIIEELVIAYAA